MKISILEFHWKNSGHPQVWLRFLSEALLEAGHRVSVYCPQRPGDGSAPLPAGCTVHRVPDMLDLQPRCRFLPCHSLRTSLILRHYLGTIRRRDRMDGERTDLLLFNYIDPLVVGLSFMVSFSLARSGLPWCGFWDWVLKPGDIKAGWVKPYIEKPWRLFQSRGCQGVFYKAENFGKYLDALTGNRATHVPDYCLDTSVNPESALGRRITENAAGRPIVLLAGMIEPRKGVEEFLRLAVHSRGRWPALFVIAGQVVYPLLSDEAKRILADRPGSPDGNLLVVDSRIEDEAVFNDVIRRSNVLFLRYRNFAYSSGILAKAAYFHKPVLTLKDSLMGSRTEHFGIGETTSSDDPARLLDHCERLARAETTGAMRAGFEGYNAEHSYAHFKRVMRDALSGMAANMGRERDSPSAHS